MDGLQVTGALRLVATIAATGMALYVGVVALLFLTQSWLIFPGRVSHGTTPDVLPDGAEPVEARRASGERVYGLLLHAKEPRAALLVFGGNGEYVGAMVPELEALRELGASVLAVDYPGYGGSEGRPSSDSIRESALAAYDELARRVGSAPVVVVGRSLGAAAALHVASRRPVASAVLLAPFTTLAEAGRRAMPIFPVGTLIRHRFDNLALARSLDVPIIVVHNRDDELVPFEMGQRVAEAAGDDGRLVEGAGGGHNAMALVAGSPEFDAVAKALSAAAGDGWRVSTAPEE